MKLIFDAPGGGGAVAAACRVTGESRPLAHVLLADPARLEAVPCCTATRASLDAGFTACRDTARVQHDGLRAALEGAGVRVTTLPALADAPDLCFARDALAATPWGLVALAPALPHRRREVDHLATTLAARGVPLAARIDRGRIEGGDVCVAMPGRLVVGVSGDRTDDEGAEAFAAPFRRAGWEVALARFDPHYLHLDTIFCLLDERTALACPHALDPAFRATLDAWGVTLIPVTDAEWRTLGCNVVSLDGRRILLAAGHPRIEREIAARGFTPMPVDVSQFTACGGGIHCLTMPLLRA